MSSAKEEILSRFSNHKVEPEGVVLMEQIRAKCRELAFLIEDVVPHSREKATALTELSFVMMSANSAIAQQYPLAQQST
jgi:hypothetical protein